MMEYINKIVEILGVSLMWMYAIVFLSIALLGGKISIEIDGLNKLFKLFK
jgi:hypothetical protein